MVSVELKVTFTTRQSCEHCGVLEPRGVKIIPQYVYTMFQQSLRLCLPCAVELRSALTPAWKEHHKQEAQKRPEVMDRFQEMYESHNAAVRMRDMSDEDFLGVLEVFRDDLPLVSVQSRIVAEAIRRLGGEDEWVDESEEATERR